MNENPFRRVWALYVKKFTPELTQAQIGALADVNQSTVGRWLQASVDPDPRAVIRFARNRQRNPVEALVAAGLLWIEEATEGLTEDETAVLFELLSEVSAKEIAEQRRAVLEQIPVSERGVRVDLSKDETDLPDLLQWVYAYTSQPEPSEAAREFAHLAIHDAFRKRDERWGATLSDEEPRVGIPLAELLDTLPEDARLKFINALVRQVEEEGTPVSKPIGWDLLAGTTPIEVKSRSRPINTGVDLSSFDEADEAARNEDREKPRL